MCQRASTAKRSTISAPSACAFCSASRRPTRSMRRCPGWPSGASRSRQGFRSTLDRRDRKWPGRRPRPREIQARQCSSCGGCNGAPPAMASQLSVLLLRLRIGRFAWPSLEAPRTRRNRCATGVLYPRETPNGSERGWSNPASADRPSPNRLLRSCETARSAMPPRLHSLTTAEFHAMSRPLLISAKMKSCRHCLARRSANLRADLVLVSGPQTVVITARHHLRHRASVRSLRQRRPDHWVACSDMSLSSPAHRGKSKARSSEGIPRRLTRTALPARTASHDAFRRPALPICNPRLAAAREHRVDRARGLGAVSQGQLEAWALFGRGEAGAPRGTDRKVCTQGNVEATSGQSASGVTGREGGGYPGNFKQRLAT